MNSDHAIAGASALTLSDAASAVLVHFQHVDPTTAASEAALLIAGGAVLYHLLISLIGRCRTTQATPPAPAQ